MPPYPVDTPIGRLKGKVIAVTGAASGIALATAHTLACSGANLSLSDVQPIQPVVDDLLKHYPDIKVIGEQVDVRNSEQVTAWIKKTVSHFGRLDGAANIAGTLGKGGQLFGGPIRDFSTENFELIMSINCTGLFNCLKAELNNMEKNGSIVNAASVAGLKGTPNMFAYGVSKAGVISMTKSAAREEGERNIRVNAVAPGLIDTPMVQNAEKVMGKEIEPVQQALKRKADPLEVARLIAFLLSDDASFITGSVYTVDAGWSA